MTPSTPSFKVAAVESPAGARILKLSGPLTIQTLFDFQQIVRQETTKPIILDVSGVAYMDSHGRSWAAVVSACHVLPAKTACAFNITGLGDRIKTLFAVTHVDGLLPCFDTLESAEASVKP